LPDANGPGGVNNGRMRAHYLPESWSGRSRRGTGRRRGQDPNARLDYPLTVSCFWIVSRGNNCQYCLGHQELKLRGAGLDDDTIAALDSDWSRFDPRKQLALAFARKLTLEPYSLSDDDIANLQGLFSDVEIIELTYNIARFNSTNRWTDGMGLPQDQRFHDGGSELTTPTSVEFQNTTSIVAPNTRAPRPAAPTIDEARLAIDACRTRAARIKLPPLDDARSALADVIGQHTPLAWQQAMSALGETGLSQVRTWNTILTDEHLPVRLKSELAYISAMNNRAWYAAAHAANRLQMLGASADELAALHGDQTPPDNDSAAAHQLAAKLTAHPHLITDADIAAVRAHFSDHETAQIVHVICMANLFDRFTEALGLPLEDGVAAAFP
jgi:alkylhydroperoxidase family enzyme